MLVNGWQFHRDLFLISPFLRVSHLLVLSLAFCVYAFAHFILPKMPKTKRDAFNRKKKAEVRTSWICWSFKCNKIQIYGKLELSVLCQDRIVKTRMSRSSGRFVVCWQLGFSELENCSNLSINKIKKKFVVGIWNEWKKKKLWIVKLNEILWHFASI